MTCSGNIPSSSVLTANNGLMINEVCANDVESDDIANTLLNKPKPQNKYNYHWLKECEHIPNDQKEKLINYVTELCVFTDCSNNTQWNKKQILLRKKYKICPKKAQMKVIYNSLIMQCKIKKNILFENFLQRKSVRSLSGVLVITIFTSPYPKYYDSKKQKWKTQSFSCKHNCYYCPNEPNMPRSYLSDEPGVRRGARHHWNAIEQFYSRANTLQDIGHVIDKIEIIILGGTWSEYPLQYQQQFIRDIFWSANTFSDGKNENEKRKPLSLKEEHKINESARCRIIGLTLETRPDSINLDEIKRMRDYGCTRLQIGIQHTNDKILKIINRGCFTKHAIKAVRLLKNCGFKIDFHIMPDLPGSSIECDKEMIEYILYSDELQADQWKLYPCQTVPWTVIKKWFDSGKYQPFAHSDLIALLIWIKVRVHPWIRLNRIIRDIPQHYISAGNPVTNLRQILNKKMKEQGIKCRCIRCREIGALFRDSNTGQISAKKQKKMKEKEERKKNYERYLKKLEQQKNNEKIILDEEEIVEEKNVLLLENKSNEDEKKEIVCKEREYNSSEGKEIFISYETMDEAIIYGFIRLRLPFKFKYKTMNEMIIDDGDEYEYGSKYGEFEHLYSLEYFPELFGCALIRELHVYGALIGVGDKCKSNSNDSYVQHFGFGKKLMAKAESMAIANGYLRVAVIAGIGTRNYYRKIGYKLIGTYMVKKLKPKGRITNKIIFIIISIIFFLVAVIVQFFLFS